MNKIENINRIRDYYNKRKLEYNILLGKYEATKSLLENINKELNEHENRYEKLVLVDALFKETSEFTRKQLKDQLETLVTNCLSLVFENNLKFIVELGEQRNKNTAEFFISEEVDGITNLFKIEDSRGGGIVDIVSLALRISFLLLYRPQIDGPLILDEPAKHVSEDYIFNVSNFLKEISNQFDRQIIMITHNEHISSIGERTYRVNKVNGVSKLSLMNKESESSI